MVKPGEICDDGGFVNTSNCLANCMGSAPGYSCDYGTPTTPSICHEVCGDWVLTPSEGCDDNNTINYDGCSSTC